VRRPRALATHAGSALLGMLVGAVVVLGADGLSRTQVVGTGNTGAPVQNPDPTPQSMRLRRPRGVLLAWATDGGIPAQAERAVERLPHVGRATIVRAGLDWISSSRLPDGTIVDSPPHGLLIPFEMAAVDPKEYATFVPPSERDAVLSLDPGEILLAQTSAQLRKGGAGLEIDLVGRSVRVAGVVSDAATNGYEAIMPAPSSSSWRRVDPFLLVHARNARRAPIEEHVRSLLRPEQRLRVRFNDEQPFMRYGDAVHPQMIIKREFGEFAGRPLPDGRIEMDPRWVRQNIRTVRVPLLGQVQCHRSLIPQLRQAMRSLADQGLGNFITSYNGCYNPRFLNYSLEAPISHHTWGMAIDINAGENPYGTEPNFPRKVVDAIEDWGFTWGGRWLKPDGMHFEWQKWP
jgi:D-alanyl-D-alanine carboxypeptidase